MSLRLSAFSLTPSNLVDWFVAILLYFVVQACGPGDSAGPAHIIAGDS